MKVDEYPHDQIHYSSILCHTNRGASSLSLRATTETWSGQTESLDGVAATGTKHLVLLLAVALMLQAGAPDRPVCGGGR
jgi:hypothetical protein